MTLPYLRKIMDLTFKTEEGIFNCRVCAVFLHDRKLLVIGGQHPPYYYLPGGRVQLHETMETAVLREVREELGIEAKLLRPLLCRLFPSVKEDRELARSLSGNICANILGLGNAATPMGIKAAKRLHRSGTATEELCRLIVLNTASIQLIPANVAAVRAGLGCTSPFDLLPAVWITSAASAGLGVAMAWLLGKVWKE